MVASRVQIKQTAVSYPGVGRFRRAETGILGRAIKGVPWDSLFYLGWQSCEFTGNRAGVRKTALLRRPQGRAALVAGHFNVVERGENFCHRGKFVAVDGPLCEEFAIAVRDEHAAADESARCESVLA